MSSCEIAWKLDATNSKSLSNKSLRPISHSIWTRETTLETVDASLPSWCPIIMLMSSALSRYLQIAWSVLLSKSEMRSGCPRVASKKNWNASAFSVTVFGIRSTVWYGSVAYPLWYETCLEECAYELVSSNNECKFLLLELARLSYSRCGKPHQMKLFEYERVFVSHNTRVDDYRGLALHYVVKLCSLF